MQIEEDCLAKGDSAQDAAYIHWGPSVFKVNLQFDVSLGIQVSQGLDISKDYFSDLWGSSLGRQLLQPARQYFSNSSIGHILQDDSYTNLAQCGRLMEAEEEENEENDPSGQFDARRNCNSMMVPIRIFNQKGKPLTKSQFAAKNSTSRRKLQKVKNTRVWLPEPDSDGLLLNPLHIILTTKSDWEDCKQIASMKRLTQEVCRMIKKNPWNIRREIARKQVKKMKNLGIFEKKALQSLASEKKLQLNLLSYKKKPKLKSERQNTIRQRTIKSESMIKRRIGDIFTVLLQIGVIEFLKGKKLRLGSIHTSKYMYTEQNRNILREHLEQKKKIVEQKEITLKILQQFYDSLNVENERFGNNQISYDEEMFNNDFETSAHVLKAESIEQKKKIKFVFVKGIEEWNEIHTKNGPVLHQIKLKMPNK